MNNTQFIAFGDSFINTFSTLSALSKKNFKTVKFKGATFKGIVNKNENYEYILKLLKTNSYDYGFFGFGQVDLFFSYYYNKYLKNDPDTLKKMYENAEEYVKIISNLKNIKNKIILGVLPNHIKNEIYRDFLTGYGTFNHENIHLVEDEDMDYLFRNSIIIHYNNFLSKYCKVYNVQFCNVYNNLIDNNGDVHKIVILKHNYRNIHINYEILLLVYLKKCLNFLLKYYDIEKIYDIMEYRYNEYIGPKNLGPEYNFNKKNIIQFINSI